MWELDHKESWAPRNWCFWTVMLEKTLESPLDCKEIQPVNPNGNRFWIFIGRTDAEAEAPTLRPPDVRADSLEKTLMLGGVGGQEEKGMTEDEMVRWHHWLNWHEFEQAPGDGKGQGSLKCCSPRGCKELDMPEAEQHTESPPVLLSAMINTTLETAWAGLLALLISKSLDSPGTTWQVCYGKEC